MKAASPGRLHGKTAIVMGAGSIGPGWGNGKATAVLFAQEGARVVCVDVSLAAALETVEHIRRDGGECMAIEADVTLAAQIRQVVETTIEAFGAIDILFNNVGIVVRGNVLEVSEADWDRVFSINLKSCFLSMKYVIPAMIDQGGGSVINMSSVAAVRHMGRQYASYYASKAAVSHLTRTAAVDFADKNVRINSVAPGYMMTPMVETVNGAARPLDELEALRIARAAQVPMGRQGNAWDVAEAVLYLASDASSYVTGAELVVDGGITLKF